MGGRTSGTLNLDDVTIEIEDEGKVMLKENKIYKRSSTVAKRSKVRQANIQRIAEM